MTGESSESSESMTCVITNNEVCSHQLMQAKIGAVVKTDMLKIAGEDGLTTMRCVGIRQYFIADTKDGEVMVVNGCWEKGMNPEEYGLD